MDTCKSKCLRKHPQTNFVTSQMAHEIAVGVLVVVFAAAAAVAVAVAAAPAAIAFLAQENRYGSEEAP